MRVIQNDNPFKVNLQPADYINASTSDLEGTFDHKFQGQHLSRNGSGNILGDSTIIFHNDSLMLES